jgi:hypothetical protein
MSLQIKMAGSCSVKQTKTIIKTVTIQRRAKNYDRLFTNFKSTSTIYPEMAETL